MNVRLTHTGLRVSPEQAFEVGAELVPDVDAPAAVLLDLVERGLAEFASGEASGQVILLVSGYREAFLAMQRAAVALWTAAEQGNLDDARLALDAMRGEIDPEFKGHFEVMDRIERRVAAADREAAAALGPSARADDMKAETAAFLAERNRLRALEEPGPAASPNTDPASPEPAADQPENLTAPAAPAPKKPASKPRQSRRGSTGA